MRLHLIIAIILMLGSFRTAKTQSTESGRNYEILIGKFRELVKRAANPQSAAQIADQQAAISNIQTQQLANIAAERERLTSEEKELNRLRIEKTVANVTANEANESDQRTRKSATNIGASRREDDADKTARGVQPIAVVIEAAPGEVLNSAYITTSTTSITSVQTNAPKVPSAALIPVVAVAPAAEVA